MWPMKAEIEVYSQYDLIRLFMYFIYICLVDQDIKYYTL